MVGQMRPKKRRRRSSGKQVYHTHRFQKREAHHAGPCGATPVLSGGGGAEEKRGAWPAAFIGVSEGKAEPSKQVMIG